MKWSEELLDAKHSKMKEKQKKEKEACPHTKHTWAVWNTLPQDVWTWCITEIQEAAG